MIDEHRAARNNSARVKARFLLTPEAKSDLRETLPDIAEDNPNTAERLRLWQDSDLTNGIGYRHVPDIPPS